MNSPAIEKKSRPRRILRWLSWILVVGSVVLGTAHVAWKYSGSSEWVQVIDERGIKIFVRKTPGSTLRDIRAVTRVRGRLMTAVASLAGETQQEDCSAWMEGCMGQKNIVPYDRQNLTVTDLITVKYPPPFRPREFLRAMKAWQDPVTKVVTVDYKAVPDLIPRNDSYYRVPDMHNVWLFTPRQDGHVDVDYTFHLDQGIPYPMFNRVAPRIIFKLIEDLPKHWEKYKDVQLEGIRE